VPTRGTEGADGAEPAGHEDEPADVVAELTAHILGESPVYSAAEVAAESGITLEQARRLWRALGFPESGGTRAYTPGDLAAVSALVQAVDSGLMDFDLAVTLTRALGQTMASRS
jgi:adenylate cyclase